MLPARVDKTILGIVALMLAAGGTLTVLTKYNVPQVNQTFFGSNLFAAKRDAIDGTMTWLFTLMALAGVLVQAVAFVVDLRDRLHGPKTYAGVVIACMTFVAVLMWVTNSAGYALARRDWLPKVIDGQRDIFHVTEMLIRNSGLEDAHISLGRDDPQRQQLATEGQKRIAQYLANMEELLDVDNRTGPPTERLNRLRKFFDP